MLKKAKRLGYDSIKHYFVGDEKFRLAKLNEGIRRATIGDLDVVAQLPTKEQPMSHKRRAALAKKSEKAKSSAPVPKGSNVSSQTWTAEEWAEWNNRQQPTTRDVYQRSWYGSSASSSSWKGKGWRWWSVYGVVMFYMYQVLMLLTL